MSSILQKTKTTFRISTLIFIQDARGRHLLLHRNNPPNQGFWSPIGGKLEMALGESPLECALREAKEEIQWTLKQADLHLFGIVTEKHYQDTGHWLLFLYHYRRPIPALPPNIDEGQFGLFADEDIKTLNIPETDRTTIWPLYYKHRKQLVIARIDCQNPGNFDVTIEEVLGKE